jgi:hypothetical protein
MLEQINRDFAGIGQLQTGLTVQPTEVKLWEYRGIYFWCLNGAEESSGIPGQFLADTERSHPDGDSDDEEEMSDDEVPNYSAE